MTASAYDGTIEIVKLLLDNGAEINSANGWALQTAAAEGHYEVVEELLARGADVNACTINENFSSGTALQAACGAGKTNIVELLLQHNANPNLGGGEDAFPLIAAAMKGEETILELLVKAKADVNVFGGWDNSTVLINAAAYLPQESLRLLLEAGADINLPDYDGDTALIVAAGRGDEECVKFLLDNGADIMHSSKRNENALQVAVKNGNEECLQILVDRISEIMVALKAAMETGNVAVSNVIRSVGNSGQELNYDDTPVRGHEKKVATDEEPAYNGVTASEYDNITLELSPSDNANAHTFEAEHYIQEQTEVSATVELQPALRKQQSWTQELEAIVHLSHQFTENLIHNPAPSLGQTPIKRKPAPSFSNVSQYSPNPSPRPSNVSGKQFEVSNAPTTFDQIGVAHQNAAAYHSTTPYQGPSQYQNNLYQPQEYDYPVETTVQQQSYGTMNNAQQFSGQPYPPEQQQPLQQQNQGWQAGQIQKTNIVARQQQQGQSVQFQDQQQATEYGGEWWGPGARYIPI